MDQLGTKISISCPECHGPMWQVGDEQLRRYRCYLGHVTTARDLLVRSTDEVESALWSAVRALNDRATTLEILAQDARRAGGEQIPDSYYTARAKDARQQAELARRFLLELGRGELERRAAWGSSGRRGS
jgi:two-component system, chemotaxis family, protein-glutamate methylesterase/glutaminase